MNTKKLWIFAFVFGIIAATALYLTLNSKQEVKQGTINVNDPAVSATGDGTEQAKEEKKDNPFTITKGKRAISVTLNDVQGVSGFIYPGAYVDVISVTRKDETTPETAQILLQNIKVLAVGVPPVANTEETERTFSYNTATLEVAPNEGMAMTFAAKDGLLWLMLREEGDSTVVKRIQINMDQINKGMIP